MNIPKCTNGHDIYGNNVFRIVSSKGGERGFRRVCRKCNAAAVKRRELNRAARNLARLAAKRAMKADSNGN